MNVAHIPFCAVVHLDSEVLTKAVKQVRADKSDKRVISPSLCFSQEEKETPLQVEKFVITRCHHIVCDYGEL